MLREASAPGIQHSFPGSGSLSANQTVPTRGAGVFVTSENMTNRITPVLELSGNIFEAMKHENWHQVPDMCADLQPAVWKIWKHPAKRPVLTPEEHEDADEVWNLLVDSIICCNDTSPDKFRPGGPLAIYSREHMKSLLQAAHSTVGLLPYFPIEE